MRFTVEHDLTESELSYLINLCGEEESTMHTQGFIDGFMSVDGCNEKVVEINTYITEDMRMYSMKLDRPLGG